MDWRFEVRPLRPIAGCWLCRTRRGRRAGVQWVRCGRVVGEDEPSWKPSSWRGRGRSWAGSWSLEEVVLSFAFPRLVLWCHDLAAMDLGETEKVERDFTVSRDDTYHLFQNGKGFESVTWGNECLNSEL